MELNLLWIVQLAPLAAFLLIQLLPPAAKKIAPAVAVAFAALAAASSIALFASHLDGAGLPVEYKSLWLQVSDTHSLSVGFLVDKLNLLMISIVTVIATFVHIFSYYYMAEDPSRARYFGFLSFFSFSMTGLVLSSNLLQTFLFWELVGLASYLLIGFWYEKVSAATAARKAFVINRLADLGFYLGIILLFLFFGSVDFLKLDSEALRAQFPAIGVAALGLLIFTGVMGKSAQFPFHNWLPDAMEGPTPVSALIHSATMVAAGVFLLARAYPLFAASEITLQIVLLIGMITAILGATVATVQRDIKKVMAYSTISQLGLMVTAMGAHAQASGMFHLTTHACFKSLLFLTSGVFIHKFHSNGIWEIARKGGGKDKFAMACLAFGLFSLSGIPPFSGFFSKDLILEALKHKGLVWYAGGLFVSFVTAYYSFRMLFVLVFTKPAHSHGHDAHHGHHGSPLLNLAEALPLVSLAVLSLVAGFLGSGMGGHRLLLWLGGHEAHMDWGIVGAATGVAVAGGVLAYWLFRDPAAAERRKPNALTVLLENKYFIDEVYEFLVKSVGLRVAAALNWFDKTVVNAIMVDRTAYGIRRLGVWFSKAQNGLLQDYLAWAIGASVLVLYFLTNARMP